MDLIEAKKIWKKWSQEQSEKFMSRFCENGYVRLGKKIPWMHMTRIGGTACSAILGVNKWKTATQLYDEMTGVIDTSVDVDNFVFARGQACEGFVAQQAGKLLGKDVVFGDMFFDPERPWSMAQVDAQVKEDGTPVECKCVSFNNVTEDGKEWGKGCVFGDAGVIVKEDDLIPVAYFMQCQKQLALTEKPFMYLAAWLTFENRVRLYVIHRNDEMIKQIKDAEDDFLFNHVIAGVRPPVVEAQPPVEVEAGKAIEETDELRALVKDYREVRSEIDERKSTLEDLRQKIERLMGDASLVKDASGRKVVSRTSYTTTRFNSTSFKKDHADLYGQYLSESKSMRFTVTNEDK